MQTRFPRQSPMRWRRPPRRRRSRNYRRKLREYQEARAAFEEQAGPYWASITEKRRAVATPSGGAPAHYVGRLRADPSAALYRAEAAGRSGAGAVGAAERRRSRSLPICSGRWPKEFQFRAAAPRPPKSTSNAPIARYAQASGLTREQAVRVYSFETGGTGNYDVQAGIEHGGRRAISTAMGYNQLLTTNSVELMAEQGHEFVKDLTAKAATLSGPQRKAMDHKLSVLKKMVAFTRTVPDEWSAHEKLAEHGAGLGGSRHGAGYRCRADAADPQAADLGAIAAPRL